MAGERGALLRNAFHEIAIAADEVGIVIDDFVTRAVEVSGEPRFGDRKSETVGKTLAERASGDFDAGGIAAFGVAGSAAAPLSKALELLERKIVARKKQQTVEQHGAVAGGEDEAVAIEPERVTRIVTQEARPESERHRSSAHGHAGMAGVGVLDGIGRQEANGVDAAIFEFAVRSWGLFSLRH